MRRTERGSAAIALLVVLSVLVCLGMALARLLQTETASMINYREGIAAQCIAEAGLRRAIVVLYKNGNPDGLHETVRRDYFAGQYLVTTSMEGDFLRVRSVGIVGAARRSASSLIQLNLASSPGEPMLEMTILSWGR